MKKYTIPLLIILFLTSCESQENKHSRLILDKYVRKLNSMSINIISRMDEEGNQSLLTLNQFYDRYTDKSEDFNNDLDFENISKKYLSSRNELINISRIFYVYLITRKKAIIEMSNASSAYESVQDYAEKIEEYTDKMTSSTYGTYNYRYSYKMANKNIIKEFNKKIEFINSSTIYFKQLDILDSLVTTLDSNAINYNSKMNELKLTVKIVVPKTLNDTLNDWLFTSKKYILQLREKDY